MNQPESRNGEALRLVEAISNEASSIRGDWSDPRTECREIQDCCNKLRELLAAPSSEKAPMPELTEAMISAAHHAMWEGEKDPKPGTIEYAQWVAVYDAMSGAYRQGEAK